MIALIDIGNTRSKLVIDNDRNERRHIAIDNLYFNETFFNQKFTSIEKIVVASVGSESLIEKLNQWCVQHKVSFYQVHSEQKKGRLTSAYNEPETLGVDRWLALVGTSQCYANQNSIIIDAGTATTIDVLAANGDHQGGWIFAGVGTLFSSVLDKTTKVHAQETSKVSLSFGKNTTDNVNNACWAATVGAIYMAVEQAKQQLKHVDNIIVTGGNGQHLQKLLTIKAVYDADLVFKGLKAYL